MYYNAVLTISSMMSKKCLKILRGNQNPEIEERQTTQHNGQNEKRTKEQTTINKTLHIK